MWKCESKIVLAAIVVVAFFVMSLVGYTSLGATEPRLISSDDIRESIAPPPGDAVPNSIVTEQITFAVNEDYAETNPQWEKGAKDMIDAANQILSLNTNKRYAIASYKLFSVSNWNHLGGMSEFFLPNSDFGGTTIFNWVDLASNPIKPEPSFTTLVNVADRTTMNGRTYGIVRLVESHPQFSLLRGSTQDYFQGNLQAFLHELGHTMGLGVPEWYFLATNDRTRIPPDLGSYNFREENKYDPMAAGSDGPFRFTDMNALIINANLKHQHDFEYFQRYAASRVKIVTIDTQGNRVPGVRISVYGARKAAFYRPPNTPQPLIEEKITDSSGEAYIAPPSTNWAMDESGLEGYNILIVKASKGNAVGGVWVTVNDIQRVKVMERSDVLTINVILTPTAVPAAAPPPRETMVTRSTAAEMTNDTKLSRSASEFGVMLGVEAQAAATNFITYGTSATTVQLGSGERLAVVRDLLDTLGSVVQGDASKLLLAAEQISSGQKPTVRNLAKERAQVNLMLPAFRQLTGKKAPDFKNAKDDLAWNTMLYRVRFKRDLAKERAGITKFRATFKKIPKTLRDWAIVRAWAYALR